MEYYNQCLIEWFKRCNVPTIENYSNAYVNFHFEWNQDYYDKDEELTRISQLGENLLETFIRNNKDEEKKIREYCKNKRIEITKLFVDNFDEILNNQLNK